MRIWFHVAVTGDIERTAWGAFSIKKSTELPILPYSTLFDDVLMTRGFDYCEEVSRFNAGRTCTHVDILEPPGREQGGDG